jgi:hypothetical protein
MPEQPLRGFVILAVDDDPDTLDSVAFLIGEVFGCRVLRASSVDYALRMIDSVPASTSSSRMSACPKSTG